MKTKTHNVVCVRVFQGLFHGHHTHPITIAALTGPILWKIPRPQVRGNFNDHPNYNTIFEVNFADVVFAFVFFARAESGASMVIGSLTPPDKMNGEHPHVAAGASGTPLSHHFGLASMAAGHGMQTPPSPIPTPSPPVPIERFR
jgi:hypothetical protein